MGSWNNIIINDSLDLSLPAIVYQPPWITHLYMVVLVPQAGLPWSGLWHWFARGFQVMLHNAVLCPLGAWIWNYLPYTIVNRLSKNNSKSLYEIGILKGLQHVELPCGDEELYSRQQAQLLSSYI